jgi:hypothetical protein
MEQKSAITYTDLDALKERLTDLQTIKIAVEAQVSELLQQNTISKRGLTRIIESLVSFPNPPKRKLTTPEEIAILKLLFEVKEVQLTMLMISVELSKHEEQPEQVGKE